MIYIYTELFMATATNKHQASTATNLGLQGGEADYLHLH